LAQHPLDMAAPMAGFHLVVYAGPARTAACEPDIGRIEILQRSSLLPY
jgi:hypothetical protein